MTQPESREAAAFAELVSGVEVLDPAAGAAFLRAEVARRAAAMQEFIITAPEATTAQQLNEVDVDRIIYLVGTTRCALELSAAAIVELGATEKTIAEVVRWMDVRPVALQPNQAYLGIDIAYILVFRGLTRDQRWLLHTLATWAPQPATIARDHALVLARGSGRFTGVVVTPADIDRLVALGFIAPVAPEEQQGLPSMSRIVIHPYVRYIAGQGIENWPLPPETGTTSAANVLASVFVNWAVSFAEVIAGPDMEPIDEDQAAEDEQDPEEEADEEEDNEPRYLTPDPLLEELTDEELWQALEPELPHLEQAALLALQLEAADHLYRLCQLLVPRLRRWDTPPARSLRGVVLNAALQLARGAQARREVVLLATQLTDLALDERDLEGAARFAQEAQLTAVQTKDIRSVAFATRRLTAIVLRLGDGARALELARQGVALSRSAGEAALAESLALFEAATRLQREQ